MKKIVSLHIVTLITAIVVASTIQMVLVSDNFLKTSISSIISKAHTLQLKTHLLVLGILPIYIGLVIFGSAVIGIYLGRRIQRFIFKHKVTPPPFKTVVRK